MQTIIDKTKKSSKYSNSISIFIGFLTNPSSSWLLMSTLQLIYFIPISKYQLTPAVNKFCEAISQYNIYPNVPELLISEYSLPDSNDNARKIGIKTTDIWINLGSEISLFIALVFLWPVCYLISKFEIECLKNLLASILNLYSYYFFIRFWLQNHLIIGFYSMLSVESVQIT